MGVTYGELYTYPHIGMCLDLEIDSGSDQKETRGGNTNRCAAVQSRERMVARTVAIDIAFRKLPFCFVSFIRTGGSPSAVFVPPPLPCKPGYGREIEFPAIFAISLIVMNRHCRFPFGASADRET